MARNQVNEIIDDRLFQRAQILSWQRDVKLAWLGERRINTIVNFWPKVDPDLNEDPIRAYIHMPCIRSKMIMDPIVIKTADFIANLIRRNNKALVLCEAGVTRSVFFCVLVFACYHHMNLQEAYTKVEERLGRVKLKPEMLSFIKRNQL